MAKFRLEGIVHYKGRSVGTTGPIEVEASDWAEAVDLAFEKFSRGKTFKRDPDKEVPEGATIEVVHWGVAD